jgi:hypothetical protein
MCKRSDEGVTVEHVKSCDGVNRGAVATVERGAEPQWPASDKQIAYVLGLQAERNLPDWWPTRTEADLRSMERDAVSDDINQLKTFTKKANAKDVTVPDVPPGRYALFMDTSATMGPVWKFFEVQDGKGRWKGYKFIKRLIGSPGDYQKADMGRVERDRILKEIERDPKKAMLDYGQHSGVCGACSSPLTDPESLRLGIGPKCRAKRGW